MRRVAIALLVSLSLGCTSSLQQIRERKPSFTGDFPQPYQALSRCVFERLNAQTGRASMGGLPTFVYRIDDDPDQRQSRVEAMSLGGPPSAEFEITVVPTAAGTSHVELRQRWDGFWSTEAAAWKVVMGCGQPQAETPSRSGAKVIDGASAKDAVAVSPPSP
ncbi:MAG TPA: hypothetical protein VMS64_15095 [Candidatus Methylomirabilis sp.]|nr:hypothetical protein [Candidatus Methylomirabilis sp.]